MRRRIIGLSLPAFFAVTVLLLLHSVAPANAEEPALEVAKTANSLFEKGEYQEALALYKSLEENFPDNSAIHYNLGNAYFRLRENALAIAHFRQALQLDPGNAEAKANLTLAREKIKEPINYPQSELLLSQLLFLNSHFSRPKLQIAFLAFWTLLWIQVGSKPLRSIVDNQLFLFIALCSVTLIFFISSYFVKNDAEGNPQLAFFSSSGTPSAAVVTSTQASLYSGNAETFQVIYVLTEGAEIGVTGVRGDWYEVTLPAKRRGWIKKEDVFPISYFPIS